MICDTRATFSFHEFPSTIRFIVVGVVYVSVAIVVVVVVVAIVTAAIVLVSTTRNLLLLS